jgi:PBSX family phage terminase large subunit
MDTFHKKVGLFEKQLQFVNSKKREVLFVGAMGAGKSFALCQKLLYHALYPNSLCLLTRKTRESITNSTLRTLFDGEQACPPVLVPGSYEYFESKSLIKINGGGQIAVIGCDNPLKIRSINASAIAIDESVELDEEEYLALNSRLRNSSANFRSIFSCTNPASEQHFLYKRFLAQPRDSQREVITMSLGENFLLPADFVASQWQLTGAQKRRYVYAEWCMNQGCVYKEFDVLKQARPVTGPFEKYILGVDVGYTNDPTCILVGGLYENRLHVVEEYYQQHTAPTKIVAEIEQRYEKYGNATVVIDPSAAGIRLELEAKGLRVEKANNSIDEGISRVKDLLVNDRITFQPGLTNLFHEFDAYSYREGSDKPVDKFNHAMDALRYLVAYVFDEAQHYIVPHISTTDGEVSAVPDDLWEDAGEHFGLESRNSVLF